MAETVKYVLSQEALNDIVSLATDKAICAFMEREQKAEKERLKANDKSRKTKKILQSYRRLKAKLADETSFTNAEKIELRWKFIEDLMGSPDYGQIRSEKNAIESEKKRQEDRYLLFRVERAMELYKNECESVDSEEAKRRYREVDAMYIQEKGKTVTELAEEEHISEKTVYKDLGIACDIIAVYLFGV